MPDDSPRTRLEEIMLSRELTQTEAAQRIGWHQSKLSRLLSGKLALTRTSRVHLARMLECEPEALDAPIGAEIPGVSFTTEPKRAAVADTLQTRLACLANLLGIPPTNAESLMAYLIYGDTAGLPRRTQTRLLLAMQELRPRPEPARKKRAA